MALNNFKCNHLMPVHFKGLKQTMHLSQHINWCSSIQQHMNHIFLATTTRHV